MAAVIYHPNALDNAALLHAAQTLVAAGWSIPIAAAISVVDIGPSARVSR